MAKWFSHQMSKTCHVCKWMYFAGLRKWSYSKEGVQEFREFFKYSYDCQAKRREWASWPTSTPNPRTNKLKDIFCYFDFCLWKNVFWSYNQNNLLRPIFECQVIWVYIFLITNNCMYYICWLVSTILTYCYKGPSIKDVSQNFRFLGYLPSSCLLKFTSERFLFGRFSIPLPFGETSFMDGP